MIFCQKNVEQIYDKAQYMHTVFAYSETDTHGEVFILRGHVCSACRSMYTFLLSYSTAKI